MPTIKVALSDDREFRKAILELFTDKIKSIGDKELKEILHIALTQKAESYFNGILKYEIKNNNFLDALAKQIVDSELKTIISQRIEEKLKSMDLEQFIKDQINIAIKNHIRWW